VWDQRYLQSREYGIDDPGVCLFVSGKSNERTVRLSVQMEFDRYERFCKHT